MGEITVEHEPPHMTDDVWKVRVGGRLIGLARDKATADLLSGAEATREALRACLEALRIYKDAYTMHDVATAREIGAAAIATAEKALGEA